VALATVTTTAAAWAEWAASNQGVLASRQHPANLKSRSGNRSAFFIAASSPARSLTFPGGRPNIRRHTRVNRDLMVDAHGSFTAISDEATFSQFSIFIVLESP